MEFKKKILKNGMVVLHEKRNLPVVSVAFAVCAGGVNETLEEKGISHFIEHMLYKGTPTRNAKQIAEQIEKNGGELNGFTSEEITGYWCKMPSEKLDIALDVLGDMVKNPLFDSKEMEKERKVIFEEIKMRKDNPQIYVFDKIHKFLYTGTLGTDLIGTEKTMNSIDRKKIREKFSQVYKPNNMVLGVVGDADFDKIVRFAEKTFLKSVGDVPEQDIGIKNEVNIEERQGIDQANLVFAYHISSFDEEESFAARVLSAITAEGMSSRLFSEIREKRNLAYSIKGGSDINKRFSYNFIYVGTMKDNVEKVKKLIVSEFKSVSNNLEQKELDEVKEQLIGNYKIAMENSEGQLMELISHEIKGKAEDFYNFEEKIREVKLNSVKKLASKVVDGSYSFFALVPK
jgi:predicted Zn-dependent peptidase